MGRYGIDYESVVEVADALTAQGQSATVERVRAGLGTGSFTTIGRHLQMWRRARAPGKNDGTALPEMISDAAQAVWANLSRAAQDQVAQAEVAAQTAVAEAQARAEMECAAMQAELEAQNTAHRLALDYAEKMRQTQATAQNELAEKLASSEGERAILSQKLASAVATAEQMGDRLEAAHAQNKQQSEIVARLLEQAQQAAEAQRSVLDTIATTTKLTQESQALQLESLLAAAHSQRETTLDRLDQQMAALEVLKDTPRVLADLINKTEISLEHQIFTATTLRSVEKQTVSIDMTSAEHKIRLDEIMGSLGGIAQATAPAKQEARRQEQDRAMQRALAAMESQLIRQLQAQQDKL